MIEVEGTLFVLLLILSLGLIVPELFRKFRLPFITVIMVLGAIFGPHGFGYVELNETVEFFGFLGMTFLMLMAGIETDASKIKKFKNKVIVMSLLNGLVPFVVGLAITRYFGYSWQVSLLIGVVFISSSVAIIVPSLKSAKLLDKDIGQLILSSVIIADIVSLVVLGFILQRISPITKLPLLFYYLILLISMVVLFFFIPKISERVLQKRFSKEIGYERGLRFVIVVIIALLVFFSVRVCIQFLRLF